MFFVPPKFHAFLARQAPLEGVSDTLAGRVHRVSNPSNLEPNSRLHSQALARTVASARALTLKRPSDGQRVPHSSQADQHRRPSVTPTLLLILGATPCDAMLTSEFAAIAIGAGALLRIPTR